MNEGDQRAMTDRDVPVSVEDIDEVRRYFDAGTNEGVTDEMIASALDWFGRDSHRHMLAARSIVRAFEPSERAGEAP